MLGKRLPELLQKRGQKHSLHEISGVTSRTRLLKWSSCGAISSTTYVISSCVFFPILSIPSILAALQVENLIG